jgi:hypothetical protein
MTGPLDKYLIFHGAIIILIGLFSGLIYWQTIIRDKRPEVIRGWRIAHVFLVIEGMFIVIVGLSIPYLVLGGLPVRVLVLFLGHFIGAAGSLIGITIVIYGSFKAI